MGDERPTFGSLFAGIGGIDLGLERAGWRGRWQVEYEPFCQRVLAKHWPDVTRYGDIHDVDWSGVEPVDLVAGGFPCQPISIAGRQRAQSDDRWLWPEFARSIRELRPHYVLVENVRNLLAVNHGGTFGEILGDLATLGYDAEWDCIPAAALGAPHVRDRVWVVAYRQGHTSRSNADGERSHRASLDVDRDAELRYEQVGEPGSLGGPSSRTEQSGLLADPDQPRSRDSLRAGRDAARNGGPSLADAFGRLVPQHRPLGRMGRLVELDEEPADRGEAWASEPDVGRVVDGVPARMDRLRSLGNAVVPQVVEFIGRRILEAERLT